MFDRRGISREKASQRDPLELALVAADSRCRPDSPGDVAPVERSAWSRLHLHHPVTRPASAWTDLVRLLAGPGGPGWIGVTGPSSDPVLTAASLRAVRRSARSQRDDLDAVRRLDLAPTGLTVVPPGRLGLTARRATPRPGGGAPGARTRQTRAP